MCGGVESRLARTVGPSAVLKTTELSSPGGWAAQPNREGQWGDPALYLGLYCLWLVTPALVFVMPEFYRSLHYNNSCIWQVFKTRALLQAPPADTVELSWQRNSSAAGMAPGELCCHRCHRKNRLGVCWWWQGASIARRIMVTVL